MNVTHGKGLKMNDINFNIILVLSYRNKKSIKAFIIVLQHMLRYLSKLTYSTFVC